MSEKTLDDFIDYRMAYFVAGGFASVLDTGLTATQIDTSPRPREVEIEMWAAEGDYRGIAAAKLVGELVSALESIPAEYREAAQFEVTSDYESSDWSARLYYARPETAEEAQARIKHQQEATERHRKEIEARERQTLAELQKKYGSPTSPPSP